MRTISLILVAALVACGDDDNPFEPAQLAATYSLQTVDGAPLPYTVYTTGTLEVQTTAASLSFSGNSVTFTQTRRDRAPGSAEWQSRPPRVYTMTFTRDGNDLEIQTVNVPVPSAGLAFSVSRDGSTVTLSFPMEDDPYDGNQLMVFRRP